MNNLIPIDGNHFKRYQRICLSKIKKYRKLLVTVDSQISQSYKQYVKFNSNLEKLKPKPFNAKTKKALKVCYLYESKDLRKIKMEIKKNQLKPFLKRKCQYCGLDTANTFDHYVPMSEFPEYAVLGINLIPSCSTCNGLKGPRWRIGNKRNYANLYFDKIFNKKILYCDVTVARKSRLKISFKVKPNLSLSTGHRNLIRSHFTDLSLNRRFIGEGAIEIDELRDSLEYDQASTLTAVIKILRRKMTVSKKQRGINSWKTALYQGLLENRQVIKTLRYR